MMRFVSLVAVVVVGACATTPKVEGPSQAGAVPVQATPNFRNVVGKNAAMSGTSPTAAALKKGSPEAKAAGLRCTREQPLGSTQVVETCTTQAERDAAVKIARDARDGVRKLRSQSAEE